MIEVNKETIQRAINRSFQRKGRVVMIRFGMYSVTGDTGSINLVRCFRNEQGRKIVDCTCKAGRSGMACYHIGGALALHVHIAKQRAEQKPAPLPEILVKPQPQSLGRMNGFEI